MFYQNLLMDLHRLFALKDHKGPSPIIDIFFSNERCSFGGGGSEPVRLEEKSALIFFLDLARGRAQQRAPRRPRQCDPRLRQLATASRGRDPHQFDLDSSL